MILEWLKESRPIKSIRLGWFPSWVLGLKLDHDQNEFLFNLDEKFQKYDANAVRITRRDVISLASQIFDTQGFVSPYVMQYKKLLPMLWHNNTTWDENLIGKTTVVDGEEVIDTVAKAVARFQEWISDCLLYTSPSPRDGLLSRMPSSA